jgi:hypothetical protein
MLKQILYHQRSLQHLGIQAYAMQGLPDDFIKGLADVQKQINVEALLFYPAVLNSQAEHYHGPPPQEGKPDERCQCLPWDQVLPLFEEGLNDSHQARAALERKNMQSAINKEEASASKWEQALLMIQHPPQPKAKEAETPQQKEEKAPAPPKPSPVESMQDVLMHLEEMQLEAPPGEKPAAHIREGGKPW